MTGMRIGEAAALLWSDIDFDTGLLSITKTMYYKSMDNFKPVEPKTQASVRTIYVDADTIRELKAWQEVQKKVLKNCGYVLSYNGIPTSKHTLPRALEKLAELAGVHRIKIHALRHPYVKPTTKKFITFFERFPGSRIAAHSCLIRYSGLMPPFPVFLFLKSPALHIQSQSGLPERYRPY